MRFVFVSAALLVVAIATIGLIHPDGPSGLLAMVRGGGADSAEPAQDAVREKPMAERAEDEIEKGHRAFDDGDFSLAATFYKVANVTAQDDTQRRRSLEGYHKALLGDVLTRRALKDDAATFERLRHTAENSGTEQAWLEALRAGAGAGKRKALPQILENCLAAASRGGEVERIVNEIARGGSSEGKSLARALRSFGLDGRGAGDDGWDDDDDDDTGGILGTRHGRRPSMPFGAFSKTTRGKLRKAIDLEAQGMEEYELAGPEGTDREAHRRKAMEFLRQAREAYDDALTEDPKSEDLERRYQSVIRTIAALRKDLSAAK